MKIPKWVLLLIPITTTILLRINLIDFPLERDEGEYAYLGQLFVKSISPYTESFTMKLPGTYFFFGILFQFFAESIRVIHISLLMIQILIILFLFLSLKEFFSDLVLFFILFSFSVLNTAEILLGFAFHATHLVSLFFIISFYFFVKAKKNMNLLFFLLSGLFLGISFLMKQQGIYFVIGSFFIYPIYLKLENRSYKKIFVSALNFFLGFISIFILLFFYLYQKGIIENFWFWCFEYSSKYVGLVSLEEGFRSFLYIQYFLNKNFPYLFPFLFCSIISIPFIKIPKKDKFLFIGLFIFSFLTTTPGLFFRGHYFVTFLPFLVLLSSFVIQFIEQKLNNGLILKLIFFLSLILNLYSIKINKNYYLKKNILNTYRFNYLGAPFLEAVEISKFIKNESKPEDKIAIIGSEPEIFFYTKLKSLTGYLYLYPMMEKHIFSYTLLKDMLEQIRNKKPKFIIIVQAEVDYLNQVSYKKNSDLLKERLQEVESGEKYEKIGIVQILLTHSEYFFNTDIKNFKKKKGESISIYKLK